MTLSISDAEDFSSTGFVDETFLESSDIAPITNFAIFPNTSGKIEKYGIRKGRIDRQIKKLLSGMKGFIDDEVCRNVSLSNRELRNIISVHFFPSSQ